MLQLQELFLPSLTINFFFKGNYLYQNYIQVIVANKFLHDN